MRTEEFENLINKFIEALPEGIRKKLDNVEFILEEGESANNSLFGLYHGISQLARGSGYGIGQTLPDKITIWKGTIEKFAQTDKQVPSLVRRVVWHEIGHHFGFNEAQVQLLEQKWQKERKLDV